MCLGCLTTRLDRVTLGHDQLIGLCNLIEQRDLMGLRDRLIEKLGRGECWPFHPLIGVTANLFGDRSVWMIAG